MAGGKTRMLAKLEVDSQSEMDSKVKDWIRKNPKLRKIFGKFTYSQAVELDERKWDARKLSKALEGLVRYELKQLSVAAWKTYGDLKPGDVKGEIKAIEKLGKTYDRISKAIDDKCVDALEELEEDKGDNKRGLKDGRTALKKLADVDLKNFFSGHGKAAASALEALAKALEKAGGATGESAAFTAASKTLDQTYKSFTDEAGDAVAAIDFLVKTSDTIHKNKETAESLNGFAAEIDGYEKTLSAFAKNLDCYGDQIQALSSAVEGGKLTAKLCRSKARDVSDTSRLDKSAADVKKALDALDKTFRSIEKELK